MTQDEASKIADIIATADSGCSTCVHSLCERLTEASLGFTFRMTGQDVTRQAEWSDDPEDTQTFPEVVASPSQ